MPIKISVVQQVATWAHDNAEINAIPGFDPNLKIQVIIVRFLKDLHPSPLPQPAPISR